MAGMPFKHTQAARTVLAALDRELAAAGRARGEQLSWSVADVELREMLANGYDRRARVAALWAEATDVKLLVRLSNELRQCDTAIARLLAKIKTEVPQADSVASMKARRAVNVRWDKERARNAAVGGA